MLRTEKVKEFVNRFYKDYEWKSEHQLVVYYPEITITDNHNNTHTIYDTYIRFELTSYNFITVGAFRAKISLAEVKSRYYHSHISFGSHYGWNYDMCFGDVGSLFHIKQIESKDAKIINALLFVHRFLKNESTYTNPYSRLTSITNKDRQAYVSLLSSTRVVIISDFFREINYKVDNTIKFDQNFIQACVKYYDLNQYFYFIQSDGHFLYKNLTGGRTASYNHSSIVYKGNEIRSETINNEEDQKINWQINPLELIKIKKYYENKIKQILFEKESLVWEDTRVELPSANKSISRLSEESEFFV